MEHRLTEVEKSSIIDLSNNLEVTTMPHKKENETAPVAEVKAEVVTKTVAEALAKRPATKMVFEKI